MNERWGIGVIVVGTAFLLASCNSNTNSWRGLILTRRGSSSQLTGPYKTLEECRRATLRAATDDGVASCSKGCTAEGDSLTGCTATVALN